MWGVLVTVLCHTEAAARKKAHIESSLLNLMTRLSYQDITVMDICREADIPRRTFYHYFGGKEDVLEFMIETLMQDCFLETIRGVHSGKEHMEKSFAEIFRFWYGENRKKLDVLIKNGLESRMITWMSQWIRNQEAGKKQKTDQDPKLIEIGMMAGVTNFFALLFYWSRNGYQESEEQMAKYAVWVLPHIFYNM